MYEIPPTHAEYRGARWRYGMTHRPPGYAHNPHGRIIGADQPSPCPCAPFGTIDYPRQLTDQELYSYELIVMDGHRCPEYCDRCGGQKQFDAVCPGNDECNNGPNGGAAFGCWGWGGMCCHCGRSYAHGQLP